ncbi:MAG: hypothetical protein DSZ27_04915 [Thiomicrospira sp.]|nr:MAG: hypothetical protein DSZ27_04915 [Thiomicrospira sp.]
MHAIITIYKMIDRSGIKSIDTGMPYQQKTTRPGGFLCRNFDKVKLPLGLAPLQGRNNIL